MTRIDAKGLASLYTTADRIKLHWQDWAYAGLAAIAMHAPLARRCTRAGREAMSAMMETVGQIVSLGRKDFDDELLKLFPRARIEEFIDLLDLILFQALKLFGLTDSVLPSLDGMQNRVKPFFVSELWPDIRPWWVRRLAA